ncbi:MAG: hypothetical protein RLZZ543_412 [Bacteroidota bacterium]|jgi:hypothetical protein
MLRILLLIAVVLQGLQLSAQNDSLLLLFDQRRIEDQQKGMLVLGTWSVGNISTALVQQGNSTGEDRYFYQMNALWNSVNLGIASMGYLSALREEASTDPMGVLKKQLKLEKSLLFNTGLDVAYMATGGFLLERARNTAPGKSHDQLRGYGRSIVLQGAFLLLFDSSFYFIESKSSGELQQYLQFFYASPSGIGFKKSF